MSDIIITEEKINAHDDCFTDKIKELKFNNWLLIFKRYHKIQNMNK